MATVIEMVPLLKAMRAYTRNTTQFQSTILLLVRYDTVECTLTPRKSAGKAEARAVFLVGQWKF